MALPPSGPLSFSNINQELGCAAPYAIPNSCLGSPAYRTLANVPAGQINMSCFYGKSPAPSPGAQLPNITVAYIAVGGGGGGGKTFCQGAGGGGAGGVVTNVSPPFGIDATVNPTRFGTCRFTYPYYQGAPLAIGGTGVACCGVAPFGGLPTNGGCSLVAFLQANPAPAPVTTLASFYVCGGGRGNVYVPPYGPPFSPGVGGLGASGGGSSAQNAPFSAITIGGQILCTSTSPDTNYLNPTCSCFQGSIGGLACRGTGSTATGGGGGGATTPGGNGGTVCAACGGQGLCWMNLLYVGAGGGGSGASSPATTGCPIGGGGGQAIYSGVCSPLGAASGGGCGSLNPNPSGANGGMLFVPMSPTCVSAGHGGGAAKGAGCSGAGSRGLFALGYPGGCRISFSNPLSATFTCPGPPGSTPWTFHIFNNGATFCWLC